jgi:exonuclease V gamma subunit
VIPGCYKRINSKTWQLCKYHDQERLAANVLRLYEKNYTSPFPQNQRYMARLFSTIDWQAFEQGTSHIGTLSLRKFRAIGEFLKTHELPEVLTWQALEEALPKLGKKGRVRAKFIRSFLLDLGHQTAERGLMQTRKSYLTERLMEACVASSPAPFRNYLSEFQKWCASGMLNPRLQLPEMDIEVLSNTPKRRLQSSYGLRAFFAWCSERDILSLEEIGPRAVEQYYQM